MLTLYGRLSPYNHPTYLKASKGRSQIDLMLSFAPPRASGAGAARRVNLLIVVIPAQNAALGRQVAKACGRFFLTLPEHTILWFDGADAR